MTLTQKQQQRLAWLAERKEGIGASDMPMLMGISPYGGPMDVFLSKVGDPEPGDVTGAKRRGTMAEQYLAEEYCDRHQCFLLNPGLQRHPDWPRMMATPDRVHVDKDTGEVRLIEIKTARSPNGWADPEEQPDGIPLPYIVQVQHQMLVGVDIVDEAGKVRHVFPSETIVVACVGHLDDYREYRVRRHDGLQGVILKTGLDFWNDHVETRIPPDFDGSPAGEAVLRAAFPTHARPLDQVGPDDHITMLMSQLRSLRVACETKEHEKAAIEQQIKALIGDREGVEGPDFKVTWKKTKDSDRVDWKAVAMACNAPPDLVAEHTKTQAGSRRFLPKWSGE